MLHRRSSSCPRLLFGAVIREHPFHKLDDARAARSLCHHVGLRLQRGQRVSHRHTKAARAKEIGIVLGVADGNNLLRQDAKLAERMFGSRWLC